MLLFVAFSNRKFVIADIATFEGNLIGIHVRLELFVLILETSLQASHDLVLFPIQFQFAYGLLDSYTQIGFLDDIFHLFQFVFFEYLLLYIKSWSFLMIGGDRCLSGGWRLGQL